MKYSKRVENIIPQMKIWYDYENWDKIMPKLKKIFKGTKYPEDIDIIRYNYDNKIFRTFNLMKTKIVSHSPYYYTDWLSIIGVSFTNTYYAGSSDSELVVPKKSSYHVLK